VFLVLLYGSRPTSSSPVTKTTPPKTDRNREIYQRYLAGESPSLLAREYGISEQRVFVIIRKFKSKKQ
jgi:Mor family transcriptional regulator